LYCRPRDFIRNTKPSPGETHEEINLGDEHIEVLGELGPYYTQAGFKIIPVVALVKPGYVLRANPNSVSVMIGLYEALLNFRMPYSRSN